MAAESTTPQTADDACPPSEAVQLSTWLRGSAGAGFRIVIGLPNQCYSVYQCHLSELAVLQIDPIGLILVVCLSALVASSLSCLRYFDLNLLT